MAKGKISTVLERLHRLGSVKDGGGAVDKQESIRRDVLLTWVTLALLDRTLNPF